MSHDKKHLITGSDHLVTGLTPFYYLRVNATGTGIEESPIYSINLSSLVPRELLQLNSYGDAIQSSGFKLNISGVTDGQSLIYNSQTQTWVPSPAPAMTKYIGDIYSDGINTLSWTVVHNLNSRNTLVQVMDSSGTNIDVDIIRPVGEMNSIIVESTPALPLGTYTVLILAL